MVFVTNNIVNLYCVEHNPRIELKSGMSEYEEGSDG